jgi:hypothetical protein
MVRMVRIVQLAAVGGMSALLAACVIAPGPADRTPDGLAKVQSTRVDSLYVAPGTSLARYQKVLLDSVDVAFKPDWQARHPQVSPDEVAMIRHGAVSVFREQFANELAKSGYSIATAPGADVLRVTASVVDLDISSSGGADPASRQFMVTTGDMSLVSELRDSQSGAMLARIADKTRGRSQGDLKLSGQAAQTSEARAAFTMWASYLREALDDARKAAEKEKT